MVMCNLYSWIFFPTSPLFSQNDDTGLYSYLAGVPKALLPGIGGKKILDFWWETVNMCVTAKSDPLPSKVHKGGLLLITSLIFCRRQLFTEVYLVTNADK